MRLVAVGGLCLLLVVAGAGFVGGGLADDAPASGAAPAPDAVTTPTPASNDTRTQLTIGLQPNGNAQWTVATFVPIESETDRQAFEDLRQEWVAGSADVGPSVDLFRSYAAASETVTGREMAIRDVSVNRTGYVLNDTGVLVLRFTWLNFARTTESRVIVDDVFRTPNGTWLPSLQPNQVLIIQPPEGYLPTTAPAPVTNGTLRFEGPKSFEPGELSITFERSQVTPTTTTSPPPTTSTSPTTSPGPPGEADLGTLWIAILVVAVVVAVYFARSDRGPDLWGGTGAAAGESGDDGDGAATAGSGGAPAPEPAPEPTPADPYAGVDVDLLSDEERVTRLLEANGGRMKQATIVKETGWSNAKVSQLLSGMDEEDRIEKLRIGRENLISLPGEEVGGSNNDE